jgi:hypothetical protein
VEDECLCLIEAGQFGVGRGATVLPPGGLRTGGFFGERHYSASNTPPGWALLTQYGDSFSYAQTARWAIIAAFIVVPLLLSGLSLRRKSATA